MDYPGKVITKNQVTPTQTSATGVWTLDDAAAAVKNNNWPVALVPNPISKSLRFNSADSAYLNRTPASAGNRKTWTWSGWVKRSALGAIQFIFGAYDNSSASNSTYTGIGFGSTDTLSVAGWSAAWRTTTQVFRDPSACYHIVVALDTTQATANNRVKVYVNGVEITAFGTTNNPTQNDDLGINATNQHRLGSINYSSPYYFSGYMTEVNFIDGQALTPSDFGLTNPQTGQWIPKKYTGTYGTNGFYLNFKDATSTTTLGYDYSGNANNWTTNNFSVTAGAGNDSLTDVPTPWFAYNTTGDVGGVIRGNYATMNPVAATGGVTLTNGNLRASVAQKAAPRYISVSTIAFTGIIYAEVTVTPGGGPNPSPSIGIKNSNYKSFEGSGTTAGQFAYGFRDSSTPNILKDENGSSSTLVAGGSISSGSVMMLAVDVAAGKMWLGQNGSWLASGNPATGANPAISGFDTTVPYWFYCATDQGTTTDNVFEWNFGQRPFAYTPPTGFRSLCTTNLPATAIGFGLTNQANKYFDATTYTGTGSAQNITNSGSMQPDFVWLKSRSAAYYHSLVDSVRGVSKYLQSNSTAAEVNDAPYNITAFNSNGFTQAGNQAVGENGTTYVAWQWRASNATAVTNTAGSITSTVSANTTAGFSVVTYTGTGANATVGHGLGVAPSMVIIKNRSAVADWGVYHSGLSTPSTALLLLNTTAAQSNNATYWNSTIPSSSVFSLGTAWVSGNYVAYCFAAVPGYSAFGSYTGNGSADGPFVYTGFRPRYLLIKRTDSTADWYVQDTSLNPYNLVINYLYPNLSNAQETNGSIDILSNGFKLRNSFVPQNTNGATIIYAAFAEFPFQFANAR